MAGPPACRCGPTGSPPRRGLGAAVALGDGEGEVEGLAPVEARVAGSLVPLRQVRGEDAVAAAHALGDVVPGELDVNPPRVRPGRAVDLEEPGHLVEHVVEVPRLVPARRL